MVEVADQLIAICRAGRAGRRLEWVPAFAAYERDLVTQRDALVQIESQKAAKPKRVALETKEAA